MTRDHMLELSGKVDFFRDKLEQLVEVPSNYKLIFAYFTYIFVRFY